MKNLQPIRLSVNRSSSAARRITFPAVTLISEMGFPVEIVSDNPEASSLEHLLAALVEQKTDCVIAPGDALRHLLPDRVFTAAVLRRQSSRMYVVAAPGILKTTVYNPLGLASGSSVAYSSVGQRAQLLALCPDLKVSERIFPTDTLAEAFVERNFDAALISAQDIDHSDLEDVALISLRPEIMLPPPCSGTTVVIARKGDPLGDILAHLDDTESRRCFTSERALAQALGWPPDLLCLATPTADGGIRLQATIDQEASDPRAALARVGAVASSPEAAAELCLIALNECQKYHLVKTK